MIHAAQLLADTRRLANDLVDDLRLNADDVVLQSEYAAAVEAGRTALPKPQWAEGVFAQVAVSWVLGCVFVRFCEDNGLVSDSLLSGTGNRRDLARDQRSEFLRLNPSFDDRDWLRHIFTTYRSLPATGDIFGSHNPLWLLQPSADGARELVQAFQRIDAETGELAHDFTDPTWDTRFLGDLYQDLSDHAKKQFALLQTPIFVEEFILDHTLEPAIKTFGLKDADVIDPTCGSGHFLLGAFERLFHHWLDAEPATNRRELARRSLEAIGGVDVNPFAVSIARFRLLLAALHAGGDRRLADAPTYPVNVAVGDSLLHNDTQLTLAGIGEDEEFIAASSHGYSTEDLEPTRALLARQWAAVVGNPPYIVVRDAALNALYRKKYSTCRGKYSLGVPFTERFWQLARSTGDRERAGFIGMITANSFMKREMGKNLIENWVPRHDITHLIDTSGAYIPGHGTPTVILFGRNRAPASTTVRAVMGIRGEPSTPAVASEGLVWTSIVQHLDKPGSQTDYVSIVDLERDRLRTHPWSIGGGGASELKERLDGVAGSSLGTRSESIGVGAIIGADDALLATSSQYQRSSVPESVLRDVITGDVIRDWTIADSYLAFFPYLQEQLIDIIEFPMANRRLWPYRTTMWARATFSRLTYREEGRAWWEWHQVALQRLRTPLSIAFSFVATHNHFVLDRGGKVFKQSAPVIKLPEGASESRHLDLLGVLNSSTACFWMKQVFHNKGDSTDQSGARVSGVESWIDTFEFDATKLQQFPLPKSFPNATATALDEKATAQADLMPASIGALGVPSRERLTTARVEYDQLRRELVALQEQLDWECYRLYGLLEEDLTLPGGEPPLELGQRAFEIMLARRAASGEVTTSWFDRHGSTPITELPSHWSPEYRDLVERRIAIIEANPEIGLIERAENKRRWNTTPWDAQQTAALESWMLDRLESPRYWASASLTSTARLSAIARADDEFVEVAHVHAGRDDVDIAAVVAELVKSESVPFLSALRYKDSGLRKWPQWLETWDLQRREDAGEDVGAIPVPPKYGPTDFRGTSWGHRGKLDVPKERFISYPGAENENDQSLVIGWAGWDHLERARALATFILGAKRDGRDVAFLTPLLAGLAELVPWLLQWHNEVDPDPALDRPGTQIRALLEGEMRQLQLTEQDLEQWRPAASTRGRRQA